MTHRLRPMWAVLHTELGIQPTFDRVAALTLDEALLVEIYAQDAAKRLARRRRG